MTENYGKLYVVATPIGNLADFSFRAVEILKQVDCIAAEDTRHVRMLLQHYGITNKVISLHQQNEERAIPAMLEQMYAGRSIAIVSDAGTPLISDPGMPLVKAAKIADISVVPIPGPCALITALSAAGMPVNRFEFEGFLPRTASARKAFFSEKLDSTSTWIFYESSHRILDCLMDMLEIFPEEREITIARELTKLHETILKTSLHRVVARVEQDENMRKGEFVVIVAGAESKSQANEQQEEHRRIVAILLQECSIKTAVALAVKLTGAPKNALYQMALDIQAESA